MTSANAVAVVLWIGATMYAVFGGRGLRGRSLEPARR